MDFFNFQIEFQPFQIEFLHFGQIVFLKIAPQSNFGGVVMKSNRSRFCAQLLYCTSSAVQGYELKQRHLLDFKKRFLFGGKPKRPLCYRECLTTMYKIFQCYKTVRKYNNKVCCHPTYFCVNQFCVGRSWWSATIDQLA